MAESKGKAAGASEAPADTPTPKPKAAPKTRKDGKTRTIPMAWMAVTTTTIGSGVSIGGVWFDTPNQVDIVNAYGEGDDNVAVVPYPKDCVDYWAKERKHVQEVLPAPPDLKFYPGTDERNAELWGKYQEANPPRAIHLDPSKPWPKVLRFEKKA